MVEYLLMRMQVGVGLKRLRRSYRDYIKYYVWPI